MDNAAASGTTPRVPAQDTTAGTGHDGRRTPLRRWTTADSGNTHTMRVTISVPATASASAGHAWPPRTAFRNTPAASPVWDITPPDCCHAPPTKFQSGPGSDAEYLRSLAARFSQKHYIIARIQYPPVDGKKGPREGYLVYLKSSLTGDEDEIACAYGR